MNITSNFEKITIKELLIFFIVAILAIQLLIFSSVYKVNFPYSTDWIGIMYFIDLVESGKIPYEEIFSSYNGHFIIIPRLLALPNLIFNSYDVGNLFYFQWILVCFTVIFYFLLLRNDKNLWWTLIPIAAFMFSPLPNSNYWSLAIFMWLIPPLCVVATTYLICKRKVNNRIFFLSTILAFVSTFSSTIGIVTWLVGLIGFGLGTELNSESRRKWFILWLLSTLIAAVTYYFSVRRDEFTVNFPMMFSEKGLIFFLNFIAVPFRVKYELPIISIGIFTLLISLISILYYFKFKNRMRPFLPWIIFIIIGLVDAIITGSGRIQLEQHGGNEPYYIPMAHFTQIGAIVILSKIIIDIKKSKIFRFRSIIVIIICSIIVVNVLLLIPSYYIGWNRGEYYYNEKMEYLECFTLEHQDRCFDLLDTDDEERIRIHHLINYWIRNDLSIFSEIKYSHQNNNLVDNFVKRIDLSKINQIGIGGIENINGEKPNLAEPMIINSPSIAIDGEISTFDGQALDEMYLIIDKKPFMKLNYIQNDSDQSHITENKFSSKWRVAFMTGYLEHGLHKIEIVGFKNNEFIELEQSVVISINKN